MDSAIIMEDIKVYELKRKDLKGAVVIDGFPSVGLVSSIVANYLINTLKLKQIGIMDSIYFPTVSLVRDSEPLNPVRIYAGEKVLSEERGPEQIVCFISEFQPPPNLVKPIASTMLDWAIEQKCSLMISPEGLVIDREGEDEEGDQKDPQVPMEAKMPTQDQEGEVYIPDNGEVEKVEKVEKVEAVEKGGKDDEDDEDETSPIELYGIGSTKKARKLLEDQEVSAFEEGVITGVAGVLLNEGKRRDFGVISLLAEARPDYPDARAAARVIEVLDALLLNIKIDAKPLYAEAERIEAQLKTIHKQTAPEKQTARSMPSPSMYR